MTKLNWPLWLLIPSDVVGIWAIVSHAASDEPITSGIEGAYIGCGLCVLQFPFVCLGLLASRRANNCSYEKAYTAQLALTLLTWIGSNINWHHILMQLAHRLAGA